MGTQHRQTDRQTERQRDRQTERETERQTDRQRERGLSVPVVGVQFPRGISRSCH